MPFKKTSVFPLYVEYVGEIFNPHPHIPHMRIIRIIRIFRIRMANPSMVKDHEKYDFFPHPSLIIIIEIKLALV